MRTTQRARRTTVTIAATAAAAVILAGCSGATESSDTTSTTAAASETGTTDATSADAQSSQFNDADVRYATGMIAHHQQAVEMSDIILAKTDIDPEITTLAENIKAAQEPEIQEMTTWLQAWGQDPGADAGTMNHDGMDHGMTGDAATTSPGMGMMSATDLDDLRAADGVAAARLFLEQMIAHHEGAVTMAQHHLDNGLNPAALHLSEKVIADQTAEIAQMREMLANLPQ